MFKLEDVSEVQRRTLQGNKKRREENREVLKNARVCKHMQDEIGKVDQWVANIDGGIGGIEVIQENIPNKLGP